MFPSALKATDIEVKFGSKLILDGVSIEIEAGKVPLLEAKIADLEKK